MTTPNSSRPAGARNKVLRAEKQRRYEEAQVRAEEHDALTTEQKIAKLDRRLGKGVGAEKERAKLERVLEHKKEVALIVDALAAQKAKKAKRAA